MKDSGIDWIGKIPDEWEINKIDSLYTLRNTKVSDKNYPPLSVTMKGIVPQLATAAKSDDGDNRKLVKKGDFVINSRSDRRGSSGISNYEGSVSLINTILTPRGRMNPDYYNWLFHTVQFEDEFYKWGHGIVDDLWTTRWQDMKNISVLVPPEEAQEKIANFLDKKCAQIDSIIEESKKSIEEYKSWKQSVIFEAVTGKNLSCKKKDSGIDWIGKIPEEWIVSKAKTILHNKTVKNHPNAEVLSLYRDLGVVPKNSRDDNHNVTSEDTSSYKFVQKGELVLNKMKTWQGSLAVSNYEGIVSPAYYVCEFTNNEIDKNYIHYLLRNKMYAQEFERLSTGLRVGQWDLSIDDFLNTLIIYPPTKSEQTKIAKFLDAKCAQIDSLISEKQSLIKDLAEYKKSLIFEAVTGKRRV